MKPEHTERRWLAGYALSVALGLGASALLWLHRTGSTWSFLDTLCSRAADSPCARAEHSALGSPAGVPLALLGLGYYALLALLGATLVLFARRPFAAWMAALAAAGLVLDAALLSYSLFVLHGLCTLCALTYVATLGATWSAFRLLRTAKAEDAPVPRAGALAFLLAGLAAIVSASALLEARASGFSPADFASDPDQALRLAWEAFLLHYQTSEARTIDTHVSPRLGAEHPVLELVLFADFACSHCRRASKLLGEFVERHRDAVALVLENYPLDHECNPASEAIHPGACTLARAAASAGAQGRFWPMSERLFDAQPSWASGVSRPQLELLASELGLDVARFRADLDGPETQARVAADLRAAEELGVTGTPTLFINGRRTSSIPIVTFLEELLRAEAEERAGFTRPPSFEGNE